MTAPTANLTPHVYLVIGEWAFALDSHGNVWTSKASEIGTGLGRKIDPLTGGNREMARACLIRAALQTAEASEL